MSKVKTVIALFDEARKQKGDEECCISYDANLERRSISFQELWTLGSRFAHNLKQLGLKKGDSVVVATPLSIEYIVASFGVILAGGFHVSMEKYFPECEMIKETIKMTRAKFMLMTDSVENGTWQFFEKNSKMEVSSCHHQCATYTDDSLPTLKKIIFTNKTTDNEDPKGFLNQLKKSKEEYTDCDLDPEDPCLCSASLNPGRASPKLVEVSHRAIVNTARLWQRRFSFLEKTHFNLPFYIGVTFPYDILTGQPRVVTDQYVKLTGDFAEFYVNLARKEGLRGALVVPSDIKPIFEKSGSSEHLLQHILSGGQPLTKPIFEVAGQLSTYVHMTYYASECQFISINDVRPGDSLVPFDNGFPLEGVEVRIMDENNQELPRGKTGRIFVRSPYMFTRYPGQPELTASVLSDDGWFSSNDAGCLSPEGRLYVHGRRGDVISRGIVIIYPSWIEKPLLKIADVQEVMVVPVPDDISYQLTCGCVLLRPGSKLTVKDIHRMYEELGTDEGNDFFHLDHVIIFEGSLPKLPREELGKIAAEKLGLQYKS